MEKNQELLKLWQKGQTGYPIVDAGMRELGRQVICIIDSEW